jgi:hypothetical protein
LKKGDLGGFKKFSKRKEFMANAINHEKFMAALALALDFEP